MKRYNKYKDSGIPWLGQIPEHWEVSEAKRVASFCPSKRKELKSDTLIGYAPMETIRWGELLPQTKRIEELPIGLTYFEEGDIVMAKVTPCFENRNIAIAPSMPGGCGYGSSELFVYRAKQERILIHFLYYYLSSPNFIGKATSTMTGTGGLKRVSPSFARNTPLPLPPLSEQAAIVSYLDRKVSELDSFVSKQETQISYLKELKQATIAKAVTRGIDPSVALKDSGIPWLGQIPEHWEVRRLCRLLSNTITGLWGSEPGEDDVDVICYRVADFDYSRGYLSHQNLTYRSVSIIQREQKLLVDGDLLLEKSGGGELSPVGRVVRAKGVGNAVCSNFLQVLRVDTSIANSDFLYYLLHATYTLKVNTIFYNQTIGIQNLNIPKYLRLSLPLPPLSEQAAIVSYLEEKLGDIDRLISASEAAIVRVRELKQTLIADVVTGRICVQPS